MNRLLALLPLLLLIVSTTVAQDFDVFDGQNIAWVRVAHLVADADPVTVVLGDDAALTVSDITYPTITEYTAVTADTYTVQLQDAESGDILAEPGGLTVEIGKTYTLVAGGLLADDSFGFFPVNETDRITSVLDANPQMGDLNTLGRFILLHGIADQGSVALILSTGDVIAVDIGFGSVFASPVQPGTYPLEITTSEDVPRLLFGDLNPWTPAPGVQYFVALSGTESDPAITIAVNGTTTLLDLLQNSDPLSVLTDLLSTVDLLAPFGNSGPYTIFAPTDVIFAEVDLDISDTDALAELLRNHVVTGRLTAEEIAEADSLTTLAGVELPVEVDESGVVFLNGVRFDPEGVSAINGVLYRIEGVLPAPSE